MGSPRWALPAAGQEARGSWPPADLRGVWLPGETEAQLGEVAVKPSARALPGAACPPGEVAKGPTSGGDQDVLRRGYVWESPGSESHSVTDHIDDIRQIL